MNQLLSQVLENWAGYFFSIYLIFPTALGPGVYSASNRNEYQRQKNIVSGEQSTAGAWGWQPYYLLWANCLDKVGFLTSNNHIGLHILLWR
jgi:hypothetical protein